jgi:hypothetical protein
MCDCSIRTRTSAALALQIHEPCVHGMCAHVDSMKQYRNVLPFQSFGALYTKRRENFVSLLPYWEQFLPVSP